MFATSSQSTASPQASSRSGISLGQEIQMKSREVSPKKAFTKKDPFGSFCSKENILNISGMNELDYGGLGDTTKIGSLSKVFEKDNNLSKRVHELFESDESLEDGDYKKDNKSQAPEQTQFSFQELLPDEKTCNGNTLLQSVINYSGNQNIDISQIFMSLKPDGIVTATPYVKAKPEKVQERGKLYKPDTALKDISYRADKSLDEFSVPSMANTEYGELPNFIDLTSSFKDGIAKNGDAVTSDSLKPIQSTSSDSVVNYLNNFRMSAGYKKSKLEDEVKKLVSETNDISHIVDKMESAQDSSIERLESFLGNNPSEKKEEENSNFIIHNHSDLDNDTLKLLDPLQNSSAAVATNLNISNDSLAIQVKNLLEVEESHSNFLQESPKLMRDELELEKKDKSLNYSTVLNDFENTELWGYVQKFMPSSENNLQSESWRSNFNVSQISDSLSKSPEKSLHLSLKKSLELSELKQSPKKVDLGGRKSIENDNSTTYPSFKKSNNLTKTSRDMSNFPIPKPASCSQNHSRSSYNAKNSSILDFDGYIKKTCENYLNEQKKANLNAGIKNNVQNGKNTPVDLMHFSNPSPSVAPKVPNSQKRRNPDLSSHSTHLNQVFEERAEISAQTKHLLDSLIDVEESLRRSLGKGYQTHNQSQFLKASPLVIIEDKVDSEEKEQASLEEAVESFKVGDESEMKRSLKASMENKGVKKTSLMLGERESPQGQATVDADSHMPAIKPHNTSVDHFFAKLMMDKKLPQASKTPFPVEKKKLSLPRPPVKPQKPLPTYEEMLEKLSLDGSKSLPDPDSVEAEKAECAVAVVEKVEKCIGTEENQISDEINQIYVAPSSSNEALDANSEMTSAGNEVTSAGNEVTSAGNEVIIEQKHCHTSISVTHSATSIRSMLAQCDDRSIKRLATPEHCISGDGVGKSSPHLLPWLPDSLQRFKSLDERAQTDVVSRILKLFDGGGNLDDGGAEQKGRSARVRSNNRRRPDIESYYAARYANAYRGDAKKEGDGGGEKVVRRLLDKIEQQRGRDPRRATSSNLPTRGSELSLDENLTPKISAGGSQENMFYVKLSSDDLQRLIDSKKNESEAIANRHAHLQKKKKQRNDISSQKKVIRTSSPIKKNPLRTVMKEDPELVLQSLKYLVDRQNK